MEPSRMCSLYDQGLSYRRIAVMANDTLRNVINGIARFRNNINNQKDRVTRWVAYNGGASTNCGTKPISLPRVRFIDGDSPSGVAA